MGPKSGFWGIGYYKPRKLYLNELKQRADQKHIELMTSQNKQLYPKSRRMCRQVAGINHKLELEDQRIQKKLNYQQKRLQNNTPDGIKQVLYETGKRKIEIKKPKKQRGIYDSETDSSMSSATTEVKVVQPQPPVAKETPVMELIRSIGDY